MIAFLLLSILLLLAVLLFIPLVFFGQGTLEENLSGEAELTWAGGFFAARLVFINQEKPKFSLRLGSWVKQIKESEPKPKKTVSTKKRSESKKDSLSKMKPFFNKQVLSEVLLFLNRIWYSLKLRLNLEGEYGTDDPALTGFIAAFIGVINSTCYKLQLHPNFEDTTLNLKGALQGRLVPAVLIWDFAKFMCKTPIRRIWWNIITKKFK